MRAADDLPWGNGDWRRLLAEAHTDLEALLAELAIDPTCLGESAGLARATDQLALRVPRGFVRRMRHGDPKDPLLLQVLPTAREVEPAAGFGPDPVGEIGRGGPPGLLRKYRGRALLVVVGACAVHCRYCFRRHFPYAEATAVGAGRQAAVAAIAADPDITEVILSGGDPLSLPETSLARLLAELADISHVRRLRLHTRLPIVLPERVDAPLLALLGGLRTQVVVVVHANHPAELDDDVALALGVLGDAGATVLNQSVLLAGVNDSADALAELSERLFAAGALPYYLHLLDPVAGAAHFEVDEARARRIVGELAARLPGYLVPRLVREVEGASAKVPLAPLLP